MINNIRPLVLFILFLSSYRSFNLDYQFKNYEDKKIDISELMSDQTPYKFRKNGLELSAISNPHIMMKSNIKIAFDNLGLMILKQRLTENANFYYRVSLNKMRNGEFIVIAEHFAKRNINIVKRFEINMSILDCLNVYQVGQKVLIVCSNLSEDQTDKRIQFESVTFFLCSLKMICNYYQFDFVSFAQFNYNYNLDENARLISKFLLQMEVLPSGPDSFILIGPNDSYDESNKRESKTLEVIIKQDSNVIVINPSFLSKNLDYNILEILEVNSSILILKLHTGFYLTFKEEFRDFLTVSKKENFVLYVKLNYCSHYYDEVTKEIYIVGHGKNHFRHMAYKQIDDSIKLVNDTKNHEQKLLNQFDTIIFENSKFMIAFFEIVKIGSNDKSNVPIIHFCLMSKDNKYNKNSCTVSRKAPSFFQKPPAKMNPRKNNIMPMLMVKSALRQDYLFYYGNLVVRINFTEPLYELEISSTEDSDYEITLENLPNPILIKVGSDLPALWNNKNYEVKKFHNKLVFNNKIILSFISGNFIRYANSTMVTQGKASSYTFPTPLKANNFLSEVYINNLDKWICFRYNRLNLDTQLYYFSKNFTFTDLETSSYITLKYTGLLFEDEHLYCDQQQCVTKKFNTKDKFEHFSTIFNISCLKIACANFDPSVAYIVCYNGSQIDIYTKKRDQVQLTEPYRLNALDSDDEISAIFISSRAPEQLILVIKKKDDPENPSNQFSLIALQLDLNDDEFSAAFVYDRISLNHMVVPLVATTDEPVFIHNVVMSFERIILITYFNSSYNLFCFKYNANFQIRFQYVLSTQSRSKDVTLGLTDIQYISKTARTSNYGSIETALIFKATIANRAYLFAYNPYKPFYNSMSTLIPVTSAQILPVRLISLDKKLKDQFVFCFLEIENGNIVKLHKMKIHKHPRLDMHEYLQMLWLTFSSFRDDSLLTFATSNLKFIKSNEIGYELAPSDPEGRYTPDGSFNAHPPKFKTNMAFFKESPNIFLPPLTYLDGNVFKYKLSSNLNLELVNRIIYLRDMMEVVSIPVVFPKNISGFKRCAMESFLYLYNHSFMFVYDNSGQLLDQFVTNSLLSIESVILAKAFAFDVKEICYFDRRYQKYYKILWNRKNIYIFTMDLNVSMSRLKTVKKRILSNYYTNLELKVVSKFLVFKTPSGAKVALIESVAKGLECPYDLEKDFTTYKIHWLGLPEMNTLSLSGKAFWGISIIKNSQLLLLELYIIDGNCIKRILQTWIPLEKLNIMDTINHLKVIHVDGKTLRIIIINSNMINPIINVQYRRMAAFLASKNNAKRNVMAIGFKGGPINATEKVQNLKHEFEANDFKKFVKSLIPNNKNTMFNEGPQKDHIRKKNTGVNEDQNNLLSTIEDPKQSFFAEYDFNFLLNPVPDDVITNIKIIEKSKFLIIQQTTTRKGTFIYGYDLKKKRTVFTERMLDQLNDHFENKHFYSTYFFSNQDDYPFLKDSALLWVIRETKQSIFIHCVGANNFIHTINIHKKVQLVITKSQVQSTHLKLTFENPMMFESTIIRLDDYKKRPESMNTLKRVAILFTATLIYVSSMLCLQKYTTPSADS